MKKAVKCAVRKAKRQKWLDFVESINYETSPAAIWRKFKYSRGKSRVFDTVGDLDKQTESITSSFKEYYNAQLPRVEHWENKYQDIVSNWQSHTTIQDSKPYNTVISAYEVKVGISMYKCTSAPGPDEIPYSIYK